MQQILFASSNQSKIEQFQYAADHSGHQIEIVSVYKRFPDIHPYSEEYETQYEIVEQGAREIFEQAKVPIVVEDTIFKVDALGGRPGLTASEYLKEHGREGILKELEGAADRSAQIISIVGYYDGQQLTLIKKIVEGDIALDESFRANSPTWIGPSFSPYGGGFSSIFVPKGMSETLADLPAQEYVLHGYRDPNFRAMLAILTQG